MSKGRLPSFRGPRDLSLGAKTDGTRSKPVVLPKASWSGDTDKKKKFSYLFLLMLNKRRHKKQTLQCQFF